MPCRLLGLLLTALCFHDHFEPSGLLLWLLSEDLATEVLLAMCPVGCLAPFWPISTIRPIGITPSSLGCSPHSPLLGAPDGLLSFLLDTQHLPGCSASGPSIRPGCFVSFWSILVSPILATSTLLAILYPFLQCNLSFGCFILS